MNAFDHKHDGNGRCKWDGCPWPCETKTLVEDVLTWVTARVADMPTMRGGATLDLDTLDRVQDTIRELL